MGTQVSALTQALGGYARAQATPDIAGGQLTMPAGMTASALGGSVAALGEQMRQYQASTGLSGGATAHTDEWFRKPAQPGMLAAK